MEIRNYLLGVIIFNGQKVLILDAFKLLFKLSGFPVIYYGDEISTRNMELADKPSDTRKYVRGQFDWQEEMIN